MGRRARGPIAPNRRSMWRTTDRLFTPVMKNPRGSRRGVEERSTWWTASPACTVDLQGLGAGRPARGPVRLLRAGPARLPDLPGQAAPPQRVVDPDGEVLYTAEDISKGQQVFLHNGLMEYGSVFGHGAYLGPDYTADYLRRSSDFVLRSYGGGGSDSAARRTIEDFRTNRYDEAQRNAHAHRAAGRGTPPAGRPLLALLLRADDQARAAQGGDHRRDRAAPAHRVLRLDGVGRLDRAAGPQLLVHQQLAARAAGRQQADGERDRLERAVADRAARRDRDPVRRLRPLALPGLARPRAGEPVVPHPGDVALTPAQRACAWFFFVMARAVRHPDVRRRRLTALPGGHRQLLRLRPGGDLPVQPDAHLARPARDLLGRDVVRGGRHLPRADDRPARAEASGQAGLRAARRPGRRGVRHADRLVPRHPRGTRGRGLELVRPPGLRVPRPRPYLAGAALGRAVHLGRACCSASCAAAAR